MAWLAPSLGMPVAMPISPPLAGSLQDPVTDWIHPVPQPVVSGLPDPGLTTEIAVEVAAGPLGCCTQQLRIEIIRPDLEGLNAETSGSCPSKQGQAEQGFAGAAGRCGDDNGHSIGETSGEQPGSQGGSTGKQRVGAVVTTAE